MTRWRWQFAKKTRTHTDTKFTHAHMLVNSSAYTNAATRQWKSVPRIQQESQRKKLQATANVISGWHQTRAVRDGP